MSQIKFSNKQLTTSVNKGIDITIIDDEAKTSPDEIIQNYVPDGQGSEAAVERERAARIIRGEAD